jgi:hypothetical protein
VWGSNSPILSLSLLNSPFLLRQLKLRAAAIGANNLFIAAHARALGLTLVTNNTAEFEPVSNLAIDNWTISPRRKKWALGL